MKNYDKKNKNILTKLNPSLNGAPSYRTEEFKKERIKTTKKNWKQTEKGKENSKTQTRKLMNNPEKYKKKLKNKSEWGKKPKYCDVI